MSIKIDKSSQVFVLLLTLIPSIVCHSCCSNESCTTNETCTGASEKCAIYFQDRLPMYHECTKDSNMLNCKKWNRNLISVNNISFAANACYVCDKDLCNVKEGVDWHEAAAFPLPTSEDLPPQKCYHCDSFSEDECDEEIEDCVNTFTCYSVKMGDGKYRQGCRKKEDLNDGECSSILSNSEQTGRYCTICSEEFNVTQKPCNSIYFNNDTIDLRKASTADNTEWVKCFMCSGAQDCKEMTKWEQQVCENGCHVLFNKKSEILGRGCFDDESCSGEECVRCYYDLCNDDTEEKKIKNSATIEKGITSPFVLLIIIIWLQ